MNEKYDLEEDNTEDIYEPENREEQVENDELDGDEEAFMKGYEDDFAEDEEDKEKKRKKREEELKELK